MLECQLIYRIINFTAPSKPPNISQIYYTSSTSIRVHWEPIPQQYVHGRLLGYHVEYRRVEAGFLTTWKTITVGANNNAATITGLKKYGAYVFQVGAFTRKGRGTLSKAYMIRTDEDGWYLSCLPIVFVLFCFSKSKALVCYTLLVCMFFEIEFYPGNLNLLIANQNCNVSWGCLSF